MARILIYRRKSDIQNYMAILWNYRLSDIRVIL